jgi:hypothetical protein
MIDKVKQGKLNRRHGAEFEKKVRALLESHGWIVSKWMNNVEFGPGDVLINTDFIDTKKGIVGKAICNSGKLIPAKSNRFNMRTCGFPDFLCYRFINFPLYEVCAVECKSNGYLKKTEKEKCSWLLDNNIFSQIYIASKDNKEIELREYIKK